MEIERNGKRFFRGVKKQVAIGHKLLASHTSIMATHEFVVPRSMPMMLRGRDEL